MAEKTSHPIVVPVDFSEHSEAALLHAVEIADCFKSHVIVLHVVHDPAEMPGYYTKKKKKTLHRMEDAAADMLKDDLEAAPPVKVSDVEAAQKEILSVARKLADAGEIMLGGGGGDDFI